MSDEIIMISPEIARGRGGVADYSLRLAEQWQGTRQVRFLVPASTDGVPGNSADVVERSASALLKKLPERGGKVLVQYSAYGFDRFGYPRWLLRGLRDWKRRSGGLLVIMFHEIWTFWPILNRNYLIQQLHRRDLRSLLDHADAIFTSTPSQASHLRELNRSVTIELLPVGSNIRCIARGDKTRQPQLAVLFGLQTSRIRALQKTAADLKRLAAVERITKLVTVGAGNTVDGDAEERPLLESLRLADGFQQRGELPEEEVSALLFNATFGISVQDDLSVTKSGTFMAYASHGLNILSYFAGVSQPPPLCWAIRTGELREGISYTELRTRAENLRAWQKQNCSWSQIAEQFARALDSPPKV